MPDDIQFNFSIPPVPEGEALTFEEIEERLKRRLEEAGGDCPETLWNLARLYGAANKPEAAITCLERLVERAGDQLEEVAGCYLALGCQMEKQRDYKSAAEYYQAALKMEPCDTRTWYFIHNNLGFSLNQLGRFEEAESILRFALDIAPQPPNAHKNLGLCLEGLNRYRDAAECFIQATQANASDGRSLRHLEELLEAHPELVEQAPDLQDALEACRKAVALAASERPDYQALWRQHREAQGRDEAPGDQPG